MNLEDIKIPSIEDIEKEILLRTLEGDLYGFVLWVFENIYKRKFTPNWHHKTICRVLESIHKGDLLHTIITIPPRYTKTEIVVKIFTAWCFAKNPSCEFIHLAYSDVLALANSSAIREIIQHENFQELWDVKFKYDSTAKKKWKTVDGGEMSAAASGGSITGFGAGKLGAESFSGCILIDDALKPEDSNSDVIRESINNRFPQTIASRLNDRKTPMIVIMQRLHENDPVGFLLDGGTELDFTHINLPAINEDGPSLYDPRNVGEVLWPEKHDADELEQMRLKSPMTFAGQYQQRPAPAEGNIFRWFQFYKEIPDDTFYKVHSWDFTFKERSKSKKNTTDFVVGTEWGKRRENGDIYLFPSMIRARMGFTDSRDALELFAKTHGDYKAILVEDKANGSAILDALRKTIKRLIEVEPRGSKTERAEAVAPLFRAKNIWLPDKSICPWIEDAINEMKVFPNGKHDDFVDSCTQAISYLDGVGQFSIKEANTKVVKTFRHNYLKGDSKRKSRINIKSY